MNVIAINGSPRKDGKISRIVNEIIKGAKENGHSCEIIHLTGLTLKDCTGCMACQTGGKCVIRDDIVKLEEAIKKAGVIIWASPVHWGNMSAIMLKAIERLFGFLIKERLFNFPLAGNAKGKKAVLVTACSTSAPFDWIFNQSRACFGRFGEVCRYSGIKIIGKFVLPGTTGMKEIPEKYLIQAKKFGKSLKISNRP